MGRQLVYESEHLERHAAHSFDALGAGKMTMDVGSSVLLAPGWHEPIGLSLDKPHVLEQTRNPGGPRSRRQFFAPYADRALCARSYDRYWNMKKEAALAMLRKGQSNQWNTFRRTNPEWMPDLRGADLSACDLIPEGKQVFNLSGADLRGATLPSADRIQVATRKVKLGNARYDQTTKRFDGTSVDLSELGATLVVDGERGPTDIAGFSVFISYARRDRDKIRALEQWLSQRGLHVRRDEYDFRGGEQIRAETARVMTEADAVLVFWSKTASKRPWVQYERRLARALEAKAKQKKRIPPHLIYVVLDETPLPPPEKYRLAVLAANRHVDEVGDEILRSVFRGGRASDAHDAGSGISPDALSLPDYEGLRKRIVKYMVALRHRMPRTIVDPSEPKGSDAWPDNLDGAPTKRHIVYLRSSGCRWAIHVGRDKTSLLPGCLDCEHSLAGSTFGSPISSDDYVKQFERAIAGVDFKQHPVLCVYNEGNFYNAEELPADARRRILERIASEPEIRAVIVESLPEHLSDDVLLETRDLLGSRVVEVGIGLESSNPTIRALCVNKSYTLEDFNTAVVKVKKYATPLAYVLLKPSFLSEREALEDAVATSRYAFENGVDIVSIEPVNVSNFNMSGELNRIKRYRSCWLWSVVEVVRRASAGGGRVRLGGEQFAPKYYRHPFNCVVCSRRFYDAFQEYNSTLDLRTLTSLECTCRIDWEADLAANCGPLSERIDLALKELTEYTGYHA
jgi:radical SAM enzyme (TIGR01210 family)